LISEESRVNPEVFPLSVSDDAVLSASPASIRCCPRSASCSSRYSCPFSSQNSGRRFRFFTLAAFSCGFHFTIRCRARATGVLAVQSHKSVDARVAEALTTSDAYCIKSLTTPCGFRLHNVSMLFASGNHGHTALLLKSRFSSFQTRGIRRVEPSFAPTTALMNVTTSFFEYSELSRLRGEHSTTSCIVLTTETRSPLGSTRAQSWPAMRRR
jgi:hypothetical protein